MHYWAISIRGGARGKVHFEGLASRRRCWLSARGPCGIPDHGECDCKELTRLAGWGVGSGIHRVAVGHLGVDAHTMCLPCKLGIMLNR